MCYENTHTLDVYNEISPLWTLLSPPTPPPPPGPLALCPHKCVEMSYHGGGSTGCMGCKVSGFRRGVGVRGGAPLFAPCRAADPICSGVFCVWF
mmetsp:Transcript_65373/g.95753  ORF Transcript_65373/g.95753 Transcript_65373/m.95753 type:complete len:94 (+) Transcript_65373:725-1006(+)